MSPKNTLSLAKHRLQRFRHLPHKSDKKKKQTNRMSEKKKKKHDKLKLNESEANKTLYICFTEEEEDRVCYVVRSIKLSDLLLLDFVDHLQLRQVGFKSGDDLPGSISCGVLGSQIVFAGGNKPDIPNPTWHRDVYVFETEQPPPGVIRKLDDDAKLVGGKFVPVMTDLGGKLYALSYKPLLNHPSFEVFDPQIGTWSALPHPPFFGRYRYHTAGPLANAITGTKMFVCLCSIRSCPVSMLYRCPVFCFDVAQPHREWRLVETMCQRDPFPFVDRALVLDLPGGGDHNNNKKIVFGYEYCWHLGVYIMFLDENRESITKIADLELPTLPDEFISPCQCYIVHIGGQKACLVAPLMNLLEIQQRVVGSHKTRGVVLPFRFDVDTTKIDKDAKNCLTLRFMPTRIIEFYTSPSTYPGPRANGCFVL